MPRAIRCGVFLQRQSFIRRYFAVRRCDIAYLRFIIESYDGLATLSTVDGGNGTVSLSIPPCLDDEVNGLVRSLEKEIEIKEIILSNGNSGGRERRREREN